MMDKNLFGYLSLGIAALSLIPYVASVLARKTKPHIFTWVIWSLVCSISGAAQYAAHAGPGAWATYLTAAFSILITCLSWSHGEKLITRGDWVTFLVGLSAIPLWYMTKTPLIAALIAAAIDVVAIYPTFRKSYIKPREEMVFLYVIANIKHTASFFAMQDYSITTLAYPASAAIVNVVMVLMLVWRRAQLARGN